MEREKEMDMQVERACIIALRKEGVRIRDIAPRVDRDTVRRTLAASVGLRDNEVPQPTPGPVKRRKRFAKTDALIQRAVSRNLFFIQWNQ